MVCALVPTTQRIWVLQSGVKSTDSGAWTQGQMVLCVNYRRPGLVRSYLSLSLYKSPTNFLITHLYLSMNIYLHTNEVCDTSNRVYTLITYIIKYTQGHK